MNGRKRTWSKYCTSTSRMASLTFDASTTLGIVKAPNVPKTTKGLPAHFQNRLGILATEALAFLNKTLSCHAPDRQLILSKYVSRRDTITSAFRTNVTENDCLLDQGVTI